MRAATFLMTGALCMAGIGMSGCNIAIIRAVDDTTGAPIEGAAVTFADQTGQSKSLGKTDHSGELLFVEPGKPGTINVAKDGYESFTREMDQLQKDPSDLSIDVRLLPIGQERMPALPKNLDLGD